MDKNHKKKFIAIASDHNGNAARAYVRKALAGLEMSYVDLGPFEDDGKVDYVDYAKKVVDHILEDPETRAGILICGTGTGMCIVANRYRGIRAGLATDRATSELMREHNDANVLVLGQWRNSLSQMEEMVKAFVQTDHEGGRHTPRLEKLAKL